MENFNPKQVLLTKLGGQYQLHSIRGADVVALNSKAILYIRSSKNLGTTKNLAGRFFFGVTKSEYSKYSDQNLFVVCQCVFGPNEMDTLIFPSDEFDKIKKETALQIGQWKFHLLKTNDSRYLLQIFRRGKYDVTAFLNYFDFSPREFRRGYTPSVGEFQPKELQETPPPLSRKIVTLEDELLMTAKDSSNPKNFEIALEKYFSELGFSCKRLGEPGETDILVSEPVRFIVDGKSTKMDSKHAINFTRIKRHMKNNNAEFMVVVSVGFAPAVSRDAELEGATLIDIQTLIAILKIHRQYVLSPFDYIKVFRQPGLVSDKGIKPLQEQIQHEDNILSKLLLLIDNLDFKPRNIDTIKGRVDLYCEQSGREGLERREIESSLAFLSHEVIGVVSSGEDGYYLRHTSWGTKEKLRGLTRRLSVEPLNAK